MRKKYLCGLCWLRWNRNQSHCQIGRSIFLHYNGSILPFFTLGMRSITIQQHANYMCIRFGTWFIFLFVQFLSFFFFSIHSLTKTFDDDLLESTRSCGEIPLQGSSFNREFFLC